MYTANSIQVVVAWVRFVIFIRLKIHVIATLFFRCSFSEKEIYEFVIFPISSLVEWLEELTIVKLFFLLIFHIIHWLMTICFCVAHHFINMRRRTKNERKIKQFHAIDRSTKYLRASSILMTSFIEENVRFPSTN